MNYRYVELQGLTTLADGVITTLDLDMADPVSELILDLQVTQGAGGDSTEHNILCFPKIEIVDGSDVLFSLDGPELQALDIYHSGIHPRGGWFNYLGTTESDAQVAISFGRHLWDAELALDPKQFHNPQMKITFDADAGGMNVSAGKLSVLAAMFDEKMITPRGFLMTKEVKRWTTVAAAHVYTELPRDYPYRKLLLQSRLTDKPPHWCFGNIKLATDQDKKVIFNGEFRDLMFGPARENAFISENITAGGAAAKKIAHCTPTMDVMGVGTQWRNDTDGGDVACYNGDGGQYEFFCELAQNTVHHVKGWAPHGTIALPMGKQDDIEDWANFDGVGNIKLDITDGIADATSKVFIQQYRPY